MERVGAGALFAAFALVYLVGLGSTGLLDYDEACYAEVAREMDLRGDLLVPELNREAFFEKPPMLYWSQVLGYRLFGVSALGARFVNAMAALGALVVVYLLSRRPLGPRGALLAALVLGSSIQFVALARFAFTDMLLTFWLTVCLGCLHRAFERAERDGRGSAWFHAATVASGLAVLTKGAVGVALPAGAALLYLALAGRLRLALRVSWILPGFILVCAVGLSWYVLLGLSDSGGVQFVQDLVFKHHIARFTEPLEGHSGSVFYYVPVLLVGFLPWSPLVVLATTHPVLRDLREESSRLLVLFGIFSGLTLVFFTIAATKLPNYVTPALPGLALLVANLANRSDANDLRSRGWSVSIAVAIALLSSLAVALAAAPAIVAALPRLLGDKALETPGLSGPIALGVGPCVASAVLVAAVGATIWTWRRARVEPMTWSLGCGSLAFCGVLLALVVPRYDLYFLAPLRNMAERASTLVPEDERVVLVGLRRKPSVVFYGKRWTEYASRRDEARLAQLFGVDEARTGISTEHHVARLSDRVPVEVIARDGGFVLIRGRPATTP